MNMHYRACGNTIFIKQLSALPKAIQNKGWNEAAHAVTTRTNTKKANLRKGKEHK